MDKTESLIIATPIATAIFAIAANYIINKYDSKKKDDEKIINDKNNWITLTKNDIKFFTNLIYNLKSSDVLTFQLFIKSLCVTRININQNKCCINNYNCILISNSTFLKNVYTISATKSEPITFGSALFFGNFITNLYNHFGDKNKIKFYLQSILEKSPEDKNILIFKKDAFIMFTENDKCLFSYDLIKDITLHRSLSYFAFNNKPVTSIQVKEVFNIDQQCFIKKDNKFLEYSGLMKTTPNENCLKCVKKCDYDKFYIIYRDKNFHYFSSDGTFKDVDGLNILWSISKSIKYFPEHIETDEFELKSPNNCNDIFLYVPDNKNLSIYTKLFLPRILIIGNGNTTKYSYNPSINDSILDSYSKSSGMYYWKDNAKEKQLNKFCRFYQFSDCIVLKIDNVSNNSQLIQDDIIQWFHDSSKKAKQTFIFLVKCTIPKEYIYEVLNLNTFIKYPINLLDIECFVLYNSKKEIFNDLPTYANFNNKMFFTSFNNNTNNTMTNFLYYFGKHSQPTVDRAYVRKVVNTNNEKDFIY